MYGPTDRATKANGLTIRSMVRGSMSGQMVAATQDRGEITLCMERAFTHGRTAVSMTVTT
jgi:hypothetical protein